jgi:hypothetical protein
LTGVRAKGSKGWEGIAGKNSAQVVADAFAAVDDETTTVSQRPDEC